MEFLYLARTSSNNFTLPNFFRDVAYGTNIMTSYTKGCDDRRLFVTKKKMAVLPYETTLPDRL